MGAKNVWVIGRDSDCDIVINSKNVSRRQAEIHQSENIFFLINHSKHKTSFLKRGEQKIQVERTRLKEGDLLFFANEGPFEFESLIDSDRTVIDFNPLSGEDSLQTTDPGSVDFQKYVEKKRCSACATIVAKNESQCPECGSMI